MELIVSVAVMVIIIAALGIFERQFYNVGTFINQELSNRQGLEQIFAQLVTDIRSASPSSLGAYPIEIASSTSFIFYSDVDRDSLFDRVRYTITSSTLERGVIKPAGNPLVYATSSETITTLVSNVIAAISNFEYFDTNYTGAEPAMTAPINILNIRLIRLTLAADLNPSIAPQPTIFSNTIDIRNLRSN